MQLPPFNELPVKKAGEEAPVAPASAAAAPVVETPVVEELAIVGTAAPSEACANCECHSEPNIETSGSVEISAPADAVVEQVAASLPEFTTLNVRSMGDAVTESIDNQTVVAPQFSSEVRAAWPFPTATPVKKRNPKPKLAKSISEFRAQAGRGHALFYRYLRIPDEFNSYEPGPKGGAAVLVDMIDGDHFVFSFAVCSPKDPFIKDEARRLCQERYVAGNTCTVTNRDEFRTCFENIGLAIYDYLDGVYSYDEPKLRVNSDQITESQLRLLLKAIDNWSPVGA